MKLCKKIVLITILGLFVLLLVYKLFQPSHSQEIVSYLEDSNISQISIEKSIDSGMSFLAEPILLTDDEGEMLYDILENMELINKGTAPIPLKSSTIYYVKFIDEDGRENASLEFHGNEMLIFDFQPDNEPSVHKRYKISNTTITDFLEECLKN